MVCIIIKVKHNSLGVNFFIIILHIEIKTKFPIFSFLKFIDLSNSCRNFSQIFRAITFLSIANEVVSYSWVLWRLVKFDKNHSTAVLLYALFKYRILYIYLIRFTNSFSLLLFIDRICFPEAGLYFGDSYVQSL